jgi:hypothetical protein
MSEDSTTRDYLKACAGCDGTVRLSTYLGLLYREASNAVQRVAPRSRTCDDVVMVALAAFWHDSRKFGINVDALTCDRSMPLMRIAERISVVNHYPSRNLYSFHQELLPSVIASKFDLNLANCEIAFCSMREPSAESRVRECFGYLSAIRQARIGGISEACSLVRKFRQKSCLAGDDGTEMQAWVDARMLNARRLCYLEATIEQGYLGHAKARLATWADCWGPAEKESASAFAAKIEK